MTEVSVRELKARLSEYLTRVERGEKVIVTRRGEPIGQIAPVGAAESSEARVVRELRQLPWVRAGRGDGELGLPHPPVIPAGGKTLAEIVSENRD